MMRLLVCAVLLWAGCADKTREVTTASVGQLDYAVPEGWSMHDASQSARTILIWTPTDNARKESVAIIRTQPMPHLAQGRSDYIEATLGQTLRQPARTITTKNGLSATRVDGRVAGAGTPTGYARSHAVVIDGDALVHIIYTAREPNREVFELVLDHIARKAG